MPILEESGTVLYGWSALALVRVGTVGVLDYF